VLVLAVTSNVLTTSAYALNEMLRANVPYVQNKVFPPGMKQDARTPRITIKPLTPTEKRVGIGEKYGSYMGLWYLFIYRVDIWDKDPTVVEKVADEVLYAIWKNRGYQPASPKHLDGQFLLLQVAGGSATDLNQGLQLYQRTINVSGRWLSKSQEVF